MVSRSVTIWLVHKTFLWFRYMSRVWNTEVNSQVLYHVSVNSYVHSTKLYNVVSELAC